MRPLRLQFQAFGSYPGSEVVDFEALGRRGLFVVTGPTGAGKTTVFDAMVFALYGSLPGARGSGTKVGDCRSHFADPMVETFVLLEFEVDGIRYRVRRTPAQTRPKQRGKGLTTSQATATVVRLDPSGETPLASAPSEAEKVCTDLLGIDAGQFQRVVLLPQGKFTEFLISADVDREKLLRPLFGTELYRRATEVLAERAKELYGKVQQVQQAVAHHRANAVAQLSTARRLWLGDEHADIDSESADDELRALIADLEPERVRRAAERDERQAALQQATERRTEAQGAAQRFDDAARHTASLERLEAERTTVEEGAARVRASADARPVVTAARAVDDARARVGAASAALGEIEARTRDGFDRLAIAMPAFDAAAVGTAVQAESSRLDQQRQQLTAAAEAETIAAGAERELIDATAVLGAATADLDAVAVRLAEATARVSALEPVASRVEALDAVLTTSTERLATHTALVAAQDELGVAIGAEADTRAAFDTAMQRFVATQAPLLAESLVAGEPCAVCGSIEHPAPAQHLDGKVVDHREVQKAQQRHADATKELTTLATRIEGLRAQLGDAADEPAEYFHREVDRARDELDTARDAAAQLATARADVAEATTTLDGARSAVEAARSAVDTLTGTATSTRNEASRLAQVVAAIDADALDSRAATLDELARLAESLTAVFGEVAEANGALGTAAAAAAAALAASGYVDVEAARSAVLPADEESSLAAQFEAWTRDLTATTAALTTLRQQGVPDDRPDVTSLQEAERVAEEAATAATEEFTTAANALVAAARELDDAAKVAAGSADLQREYDTTRVVHRTCNGEGPFRVKMERWVLSAELGRVTEAANVHLRRMTNHRYSLQRDEVKGGLGLLVTDTHSGTSRATASLSGGEQFQASLALALGLADVVSQGGTGNGRTFEALFVDEGFGSLDPVALDQAIDALTHLQSAGRMVGAITHVEAMKQSLHVGIEVRRLADGSGSTLTVNP